MWVLIFPGGLDADGCFSGCCVVDTNGVPTILYTGVRLRSNPDCGPLPPPEQDLQLPFVESQLAAVPEAGAHLAPASCEEFPGTPGRCPSAAAQWDAPVIECAPGAFHAHMRLARFRTQCCASTPHCGITGIPRLFLLTIMAATGHGM